MIKIKNLDKKFKDVHALKNVSLIFPSNQITGLIGFNGSGKTTTFNILANFIEDHKGSFEFDGKQFKDIRKQITYLAAGDDIKLQIKSRDYLLGIAKLYKFPKSDAIKTIEKISKIIDFEKNLHKPVKSLSKGNQQKVKIIASFLNPEMKYLFLDEPFDGLDPIMVEKVKKLYMELNDVTIVITSHRMEVVQSMVKSFYILKEGVIIDGKEELDETVTLIVNKEVDVSKIKNLKGVISVKSVDKTFIISLENISYFKIINKKLITSPKYIYSSLKDKNISESLFGGYNE